jgi:hypothetical protein
MAEQLRGSFEKFVDSRYYSVYVFEKWVECCKKCIAPKGGTLKKRPSPHFHKVCHLRTLKLEASVYNAFIHKHLII